MQLQFIKRKAFIVKACILLLMCLFSLSLALAQEMDLPPLSEEEKASLPDDTLAEFLPPSEDTQRFLYEPEGRRDPFVSLLLGKTLGQSDVRPPGIEGMNITELALVGILNWGPKGRIALFKGTDDKTYQRKVYDTVYDGKIVDISKDRVLFEQKVYDPFGNEKPPKRIEIELHPKREEGL